MTRPQVRERLAGPAIRVARSLALPALLVLPGCVYYNSIYNAERALRAADAQRQIGSEETAASLYQDAARKAAAGYRKNPDGEWADDALVIVGKAFLRLDRTWSAARILAIAAEMADSTGDEDARIEATVYRAAALDRLGEDRRALDLLSSLLGRLDAGPAFATASIIRARLRLERGMTEGATGDLSAAAAVSPQFAAEVALARMELAVERNRSDWVFEAAAELLREPTASTRRDAVLELLARGASSGLEVAPVLEVFAGGRSSTWPADDRDALRLASARLLFSRGDTATAFDTALEIAVNSGAAAVEARFWLAERRLAGVREAGELGIVRDFLLPAAADLAVARKLESVRRVMELTELGAREPLAYFAAAEAARDELGAVGLARSLFLRFADSEPHGRWRAKGLLAALALSPEGSAAELGLDDLARDPYVRAARGEVPEELADLEAELGGRLLALLSR